MRSTKERMTVDLAQSARRCRSVLSQALPAPVQRLAKQDRYTAPFARAWCLDRLHRDCIFVTRLRRGTAAHRNRRLICQTSSWGATRSVASRRV